MPSDITIDHSLHGTLRIALEIAGERFRGYSKDRELPHPIRQQFASQADECLQIIALIDLA